MNPRNPWEPDRLPLEGTIPLHGARDPDARMIESIGIWIIDTINYVWYWTLNLSANDAFVALLAVPIFVMVMIFSEQKGPNR